MVVFLTNDVFRPVCHLGHGVQLLLLNFLLEGRGSNDGDAMLALFSTLIFVVSSLGLWIVGLKAPLLFGLFCGLTNVIPYAGPYIGGAPAVIVGFSQSPTIGILTLVVIAVIQFLEGNFLQPVIMAKSTKLHPDRKSTRLNSSHWS